MRALSLAEILGSLHDRFRLLTGGARTAVRRQQTLRASVDWSHALLTEPERVLFRRLAAFLGGFDLEAAAGGRRRSATSSATRCSISSACWSTSRWWWPTTAGAAPGTGCWRRFASTRLEKLGESGEADAVRARHRDHYTSLAAAVDAPAGSDYEQHLEQAEMEIDNLRAAFGWSRENSDTEPALALASSLQPLWFARGRVREGLAWFDAVLTRRRRRRTPR